MVGIDIFVPEYQRDGASKGKTLRGFVEVADGALVAFALQELWQYRATATCDEPRSETRDVELKQWLDRFCHELSRLSDADVSAALVNFSADESLPLLRANIHRDLIDGNPTSPSIGTRPSQRSACAMLWANVERVLTIGRRYTACSVPI